MHRSLLFLATAVLSLTQTAAAQPRMPDRLVRPFDGKRLEQWSYDPAYWRVERGAIIGEIPPGTILKSNQWIIWQGGELRDFDLRLQVKLTGSPSANSGIQFRCQAKNPGHVSGYQADLDMGATWLGRIYDEHGRALLVERGQQVLVAPDGSRQSQTFAPAGLFAPIFRQNDWNDYRIIAQGERVAILINGTLFSVLIDRETKARDLSGQLAFQLHSGPETRVAFRHIAWEVLEPDDTRLDRFIKPEETNKPSSEPGAPDEGILPRGENGQPLNLDFETGDLRDWTATGNAFQKQPVSQDSIARRWSGQVSNKQGRFFIGGYEPALSDAGQGRLTSAWFKATHPYASFLIAGGRSPATRVELIAQRPDSDEIDVIATARGHQREQMERVTVDLRKFLGRKIAVRLVDESSTGWGHLNFDDFRFHPTRPAFAPIGQSSPLFNPLLHHLVPNPEPADVPGETLARMSVPPGFTVDLIAAEPDLHQPMAFTFDARGRIWVAEGHCYPTKRPPGQGLDKILIFSDTDHDGTYETRQVFIEGLNLVSGLQVGHGGVWVGAPPELLFIPDRNHDGRPDGKPVVLLDGFGYADTHETINSFLWGPDGWLYGNQGVFNESFIGKPGTKQAERIRLTAGVWRYHPVRHTFEIFAHGGSNAWGLDFDEHGQLFATHCRSHFGGGPTTHLIQGGHYWRQVNSGHARFISPRKIAGLSSMPNYLLASARYGHGEGGAGKPGSRALYGGHAHVGTMIYLGDNWPAEYRNHLFTHNLHGHRINHQINQREGSGYNTRHAGYDIFHCADPQYIGVDLQNGPDGAVYISDWYDPRHCHSPHTEQWQRGNGRLYRMRYQGFQPANVDYWQLSDFELVDTQMHRNAWHARMARLVLAERAAQRQISEEAVEILGQLAVVHDVPTVRLRALWGLHVIGALSQNIIGYALQDESEYIRAWMIRLLAENDQLKNRENMILARVQRETSPLVKLSLASAAGRLSDASAWSILEALAQQKAHRFDRNLPRLIWQILAPRIPRDLDRAERLIDTTSMPAISQYLRWYLPQLSDDSRERMVARLARSHGQARLETLRLFAAGLAGARNIKQPNGWAALAKELYQDDATRGPAEQLGTAFGDPLLYDRMREILANESSSLDSKRHALGILASDSSAQNLPLLLASVERPELRVPVLRQLRRYDDPRVSTSLITHWDQLTDAEKNLAMETLCGRPAWALALLDAIQAGRVPPQQLTSFFVRQMARLNHPPLTKRLQQEWGRLGQSSAETKAAVQTLIDAYNKAPLWAYNQQAGKKHFQKLCATCHVSAENRPRIGPQLNGTGAKGIQYIVENILDPNAVIGKDFQARNILTHDGLVLSGVILKQTETAVTLRTATSTQTIPRKEIDQITVSPNSFMPEGLLKPLNDRERIELLKYLMSLK